jgi:hypothetical protein
MYKLQVQLLSTPPPPNPPPLCWRTFPLRRIPVTVYIRSILLDELINSLSLLQKYSPNRVNKGR